MEPELNVRASSTPAMRPPPATPAKPRGVLEQAEGLTEHVVDLLTLRLEHARLELLEQVDDRVNRLARFVLLMGAAAVAGLFLLLSAAYGLGEAFGHWGWGFLAVGLALAAGGGLLAWWKPHLFHIDQNATIERDRLEPIGPTGTPVDPHS